MQTNIPWLPYVSDGWKIQKVKQCFFISKDISKKENPVVLTLARTGVRIRDISNNEGQMAASYDNYNAVVPGDLLLNPMDLYSGANCSLSEVSGVISPAYVNLRAKVPLNPKFFDYYFKTQYWMMAMFAHGKGVSFDNRWTINSDAVLNYEIPFPTLKKQDSIVEYVNQKCAEIDSLIAVEEAQIKSLIELKRAGITDYMLNCNIAGCDNTIMGPTCVGNYPSTYSIQPLKFLLDSPLAYGANETGKTVKDSYRYIRITDIDGDGSLKNGDEDQYLDYVAGSPYELIDGDVLFARSGGTVGKAFLYKKSYGKCAYAGYLIKASCNKQKILPEFLYLYTQSSIYENWKNSIFIQATIQNIGANKYAMLPVVIPPVDTQRRIVDLVKENNERIDALIAIKTKKICLLTDYKKSLVYEYVTGKKEL